MCACHAASRSELIGKHELHQFSQYAVLGTENILKNTVGNRRLLYNLCNSRFFIALLEKQLDADRQNPLLGRQACICDRDEDHVPSDILFAPIVANLRRKRKSFAPLPPLPRSAR